MKIISAVLISVVLNKNITRTAFENNRFSGIKPMRSAASILPLYYISIIVNVYFNGYMLMLTTW